MFLISKTDVRELASLDFLTLNFALMIQILMLKVRIAPGMASFC